MKEFFHVVTLEEAVAHAKKFPTVSTERVPLPDAWGRVLARELVSDVDLPGFSRSTVDGFAVQAASTFGASESAPALMEVVGSVDMGSEAAISVGRGQAARILTGGMLPSGADAVTMVEHAEEIDESTIEVTKSVAPLENVIEADEDLAKGEKVISGGTRLRGQEIGALAALGVSEVEVFRRPVVAIVSTGDEVVPVDSAIGPGRIRDVNSYTLSAMVEAAGGVARRLGIVPDDFDELWSACRKALAEADMILVSGGSSVGSRDHTIGVVSALPEAEIWVHGIAVKPGKPTILARVGDKAFWGLPGHVASAMVIFHVIVRRFLEHIAGETARSAPPRRVPARLSRNVASVHGRADYVRVRLEHKDSELWAVPVLGKSGLIRTMVQADGYIEIETNVEGLVQGTEVWVHYW